MSALMATMFQHLYMQCIGILTLIRLDCSAILSIWLQSAAPSGMYLNSFVTKCPGIRGNQEAFIQQHTAGKISYIYHYTHVHRFGWNICLLHAYIHTFWPMYGTHEYISLLLPILSLLGPMCESTHIYIYIYMSFLEPMYIHKPPGAHIHTPYTHKYIQIYTHPYIPSHC